MSVVLALLPSPLLGPTVWQPAADHLRCRGWIVVTPAVAQTAPRTPDDVLRSFLATPPTHQDVVVIPHSNAGLFVPALTATCHVIGYVFVDAGLPASHGRVPLAWPTLLDVLAQKVGDDGLLPPWTRWWHETEVAGLFPDITVREHVEREQQRLPLSYFRQSLPIPSGWDSKPGAYLAFGDTYAADREAARNRGWPTATLPAEHLHILVDPRQVATEIDALLAMIGIQPHSG